MTITGSIFTILGIIIAFVWIGIGTELGKETYNVLLKEKAITLLTRIKEARAKKIAQKLIEKAKI